MPIVVKNFNWWQTNNKVFIKVEIPFVNKKNADVLTSNKFLKISCLSHIFEVFLWDEVKEDQSKCIFGDGYVLLELEKVRSKQWDYVALQKPKEELRIIKRNILNELVDQYQKKIEEKKINKTKQDRLSVNEQIERDNEEHRYIQKVREEEKEKVLKELDTWNSTTFVNYHNQGDNNTKEIFNKSKLNKKKSFVYIENEEVIIPEPRKSKTVKINFTHRHFPTPSRESTKADEQEWLKKQMEARRASGFVEEDLRPEEQDPDWCLRKGDIFLKENNYIGAISAYSHGIKLSPKMAVLYLNRSKAHFLVKNYHKTIEDSTKALELMVPLVESNLLWRSEAYYYRAKGLIELQSAHLAVDELKAALTLVPSRGNIYGPELQHAIELAPVHEETMKKSKVFDLSEPPTVIYK